VAAKARASSWLFCPEPASEQRQAGQNGSVVENAQALAHVDPARPAAETFLIRLFRM
jgi:hypothetical protein